MELFISGCAVGVAVTGLAFLYLGWWAQSAAYRNGVRDGYSNPWLEHVRKQITDENLTPHVGIFSEKHCWSCGRPGGKGAH